MAEQRILGTVFGKRDVGALRVYHSDTQGDVVVVRYGPPDALTEVCLSLEAALALAEDCSRCVREALEEG